MPRRLAGLVGRWLAALALLTAVRPGGATSCRCANPSVGAAGFNEIACDDGSVRHCDHDEECFATEAFDAGADKTTSCRKLEVAHPQDLT